MPLVRAQKLGFAFTDAVEVFADAEFQLDAGWTGLVGANGAGKTTLLRLLARELHPTSGALHFEPDDAIVRTCPQAVEARTPEIDAFAESTAHDAKRLIGQLHLETWALDRWDTLSPGERKRWQIGATLAAEPDVLLLDEPTNHLDAEGRELLLRALQRFRGVGLLVSHDRALLEALTTKTLRIHRGEVRLWTGPYSVARREWEAESASRADARERAKDEHHAIERRLADTRRAQAQADSKINSGARMRSKYDNEARSMGAKTRVAWAEAGLGRKVGILRREAEKAEAAVGEFEAEKEVGRSVFVDYQPSPKPHVFTLEAPALEVAGVKLLGALSLNVGREDRIWLSGANGAGKSTLVAALLAAARVPLEKVLHLPQDLSGAQAEADLAAVEDMPPEERGRVLSLVAALGVEPERLLASESPSPGEARKLRIALGLGRHCWALVLDEPTNHLDLPSIERLEAALAAYPGTLLLVTHDEAFARAARATTRWHIADGKLDVRTLD